MKKGKVLELPTNVQMTRVDDDCVLSFGDQSVVLSYDAAFELALKLSSFVHECDEGDESDVEGDVPQVELRHLELVVH